MERLFDIVVKHERVTMALIKCQHCEKEVFDKAYFCPNCGGWTKWGYVGLLVLSMEVAIITLAALKYLLLES